LDVAILIFLHREVEWQARIALMAYADMQAALRENDAHRFWYGTQAFLTAAANVSKILDPNSKHAPDERAKLRSTLRISDGSPLLSRELRNHFEHYDERLIRFAQEGGGDIDAHIGHPDEYGEYGRQLLRCFDPEAQQFWIRGTAFPLEPWIEALRDVRALAQERRLY
jgi:hypothetical protein